MKYMVCDAAGEALKVNRFSDATFDTLREAEQFRRDYAAKVAEREESDYQIVEVEG